MLTDPGSSFSDDRIAIIGVGCRFPGRASDHRTFWRNLVEGRDCLEPTPRDRYDVGTLGSRDRAKPGRLVGGRGGYIDGFDRFEPEFFGISPREAEHMDPQQRKLLEVTWEALEDGGRKPSELAGADVGVFVGAFTLDYKILQFADLDFETLAAHTATGTMMTMVSNRISHCFDFRGPSVSLDTACSSSLVAVHMACQSLRRGESALALAGGSLLHMTPQYTIAETKGGFLSPEGRSRTFDASADGYVRAEGVGVVALKRLSEALRDGDPVHAVITATGVNQDGRTHGITVPNADAQVRLIERVCAEAGVTPGDLQYVEAHGTSTPVGDPIEAGALGRALAVGRPAGAPCFVGSVKANIGHTESAAGVAGLIKTVMSLKHGVIAPQINLEELNPGIDAETLPYTIPTEATPWPEHDGPARAGVNSFGFGGTNAHVLLEEAPERPLPPTPPATTRRPHGYGVLPLSARDPRALPDVAAGIRDELTERGADLTDVAHTLAHRRDHLESRLSVVYSSRESLVAALDARARGETHPRVVDERVLGADDRRLVWVFTGMGPQWWAMGRRLLETEPVYRAAVQRCDREIARLAGWSLIEEMSADEDASRMDQTWLAQPANFAVQVGLAALWRSWGVRPDAVVGHSTGEVAAFHEAGVYTLEEAVAVVVHRSRLQQTLVGTGTMLAAGLTEEEAAARARPFGDRVSVAAVNAPASVTFAGDADALEELAGGLADEGAFHRFLGVRVPYHSARMAPIRDALLASLADLSPKPAGAPLYLTGREGRAEGPELDAGYWWDNVRGTVRFRAAADLLIEDGHGLFLEIGPHPVLAHAIRECLDARDRPGRCLPSIRRREDEAECMAVSLATLHGLGVEVDWSALQPGGSPVTLPPYPWRRDRYWAEPGSVARVRLGRVDHPLLGRRLPGADPAWEASLDTEAMPYLADHRIQGNVVFPAAGYLGMAVQAARTLSGGEHAGLADVEFRRALFLPEGSVTRARVSFAPHDASFTVATGAADGRSVHATGTVRTGQPRRFGPDLATEAVRERAARVLDADTCYDALDGQGYHYGPAFRGMERVWIGADEALALVRPTEAVGDAAADHHVHPVVLDSCFQTLLTTRLPWSGVDGVPGGSAERTGIRLPVSVAEMLLDPVGAQPVWAHATVTAEDEDGLTGDIRLYTEDGTPLGAVTGLRAVDVERAPTSVGTGTIDGWLSDVVWVPAGATDAVGATATAGAEGPERAVGATAATEAADRWGGEWLLLADSGGTADALAALVAERGGRCHLVRPGDGYRDVDHACAPRETPEAGVDRAIGRAPGTGDERTARGNPAPDGRRPDGNRAAGEGHGAGHRGRTFEVAPDSAEDFGRVLDDLGKRSGALTGIVHLWNLDAPPFDRADDTEADAFHSTGSYSLVALAQALRGHGVGGALHVVTRRAQGVLPGEEVEPLGAPAWGVGRVLWQQELTDRRGTLLDLGSAPHGDRSCDRLRAEAAGLLAELTRQTGDDEVALRGADRYVSRLLPVTDLPRPLPLRLRADGAYLVTGAFGALGRLVCRTLVRRGARRLILVGRTPLPERSRWRATDPATRAGRDVGLVRELEGLGAHVEPVSLDLTDADALAAWLDARRTQDPPPLRGLFHLAGHVDDTLLPAMDRSAFDAVYAPKAAGARLLHRLLADEPLEHFVLFSSVAGLLTTAGQTNYAAGNAFLDALAHHRRARGLPAISLDWGPWATGMIEELGLVEHYRTARGMGSLSPEAGMAVLERVIEQDRAQLLVCPVVDWPAFLAWYSPPPPLVSRLAEAGTARTGDGPDRAAGFPETFAAAPAEDRPGLLTHRLTEVVARILRVAGDRVDPSASLYSLGMDSLLAMELRAAVLAEVGVAVPVVTLLGGGSIGDLVGELHERLSELVADGAVGGAGSGSAEVFTDPGEYPLTQNQKALWFLEQLNPDGFAYNIGGAVQIRAELDPDTMFAAFRAVVDRHPCLRTNVLTRDGRAVQRVHPAGEATTDHALVDVGGRPWEEIHALIVDAYRAPYDLERDPLVRFRLYRRADDHWVIVKAVHHIVSDAISTFTFIEELFAVYEGLRAGRPVAPPAPEATYLDFLNHQNRFLAGPDAARMREYWIGRLPDEVPALDLPTDRPRPLVQTNNGASEFFTLDADLSERVRALAEERGVTVFVVLLSAYYLFLQRYSGQDDLVVGSPVTGRTSPEFGSVYGYFVNPLPLHTDLSGDPSVAELLDRVRATVLGGLDHQEYPFVLLVEELGPQHDPSRSAVFQAMFILLTHNVSTERHGYRLEYVELPEEEGQFDLTLSAYEERADGLFHCVFKYNTDLFDPDTVRRMLSHYVNLLQGMTRGPSDRPVSRITMLGAAERRLILDDWSGRRAAAPPTEPVHVLFGRAAKAAPDAVAVSAPTESGDTRRVTYGELDERSARLAAALRVRAVGRGAVVALCLTTSPDLVALVMAVLRAGAAYLPLDPAHPVDRLAALTEAAGARLVVTDDRGAERLSGASVEVVSVAELNREAARVPTGALRTAGTDDAVDAEATAYLVSTSGSTGRPKLVRVGHGNLAAAYAGWRDAYRLEEDARVHLQMANPAFDVFTGDLVRALCSGGTLVLAARELLLNSALLYDTMVRERVDCGEFVPSVVRGLMAHCERDGRSLGFLRLLVVGSDVWRNEEYLRLRALCGRDTRVVNSYGLSEATIDTTWFEGSVDAADPGRTVPIGRPFPGGTVHVLDAGGEPVPPGVIGELWVGGTGVAQGYVGDPEQTAACFVTRTVDHGDTERTVRLYRTGDLVHWDATGVLHLVGRADSRVKVRGHRVEIGEIESRLAAWPTLEQAVVTVRPDASGNADLCAYCVPTPGTVLDVRGLRRHLAEALPTFMIPSAFVEMAQLPVTTNGKVDTAALPVPRPESRDRVHEPPVTLYEARMAEHWRDLLRTGEVGLRDDFFELGGGSVLLIELVHRLQHEFNATILVSHLFRATTLHGMAATLEGVVTGRISGAGPYLEFNRGGARPHVFCFPPAGGHGLAYRKLAGYLCDHHLVAFNHLAGDDKVARYADLVESVRVEGPYRLFGYSLGGNLAFEVAKELEGRGHRVRDVVAMDAYRVREEFEFGPEHLAVFERELSEHMRGHTGSETVAAETLEQAREYIGFCARRPNTGTVAARITVVADEKKADLFAEGEEGSWYGSSSTATVVLAGSGEHADMLDDENAGFNAALVREALGGEADHGDR
ncbi:amino acid adenylation domain-containing protein [Nocardiopsis sp. EMB25]|uniref:non-ribosomal peptide synthetase/type I polyketide synthase n=1 Tax=Nocardiopsis sp. EMB25 TaxID=2835867 RepID=UPI0022852C74|nr:non-ribosomal peptide synthetase/type I polyketide synthase [Nocardiopsis sp. EMB25]MCY9785316.1 amino acid adenylation domain-containing protein [Nocardiopsis sp. EMB25]